MTTTNKITAVAAILGGVVATVASATAALNLPTQSCSYNFTVNMKKGTRNAQVMDLQKVLNMYPQTTIATSGAGSAGNETTYYGAATAAAVSRFQELHAADTLSPIGATKGTGNAFSLTRAVLNQICNGNTTTPTTPTTTSGNVSVMLSSNQPSNVLVSGQATARLADFSFTGNGTVTNVKLMRTGVSANDTLSNVYLFDGAMRVAGPASVSTDGSINFGSVSGIFSVNGSKTLTVRSDIKAGVSGQSVGVNLVGYTVMGSAMATTNVMGSQLSIANVVLLTANLTTTTPSPAVTTVNAGTMNQTVWSQSLSIGTRAAKLHGLTVKMIGSAPVNSVANVKLYVDGASVANAGVTTDGYMTFDLSAMPLSLTTGSHTLDVRADIVGGANRNFYVVMEQASDMRVEDSQVTGAFVGVTYLVSTTPAINVAGGQVNIGAGSLTVTQDTAFNNTTSLVGGATNVKLAAYKFTSYGEDVKVTTLSFQPTFTGMTPGNNSLANVGVYVNGGQVSSNQTAVSGTPLVYSNLGTNLLIPAGSSVVVEIRGDIMSSTSTNYTAGSIKFDINATANSVQGISSSNLTANPTAGGQTLTVASTNVTFASTSGFSASTKAPNQTAVKIGSFTVQTGSAEGVNLSNIAVTLGGTMIASNQITNLTVKDGSTVLGNVIGNPVAGSNNFSTTVSVGVGSTKVLDVYGDFGSSAAGLTATTSMVVTYRGATSNLTTLTSSVTGPTISAGVASIVAAGVTFNTGLSPVSQVVVGGQSNFGIATFNFKVNNSVAGGTLKDVTFTVPANTVSSISMNGKTASVVGTTATIYNVGAVVPADASGINLPVTVALVCAGTANGCPANSPVTVNLAIPTVTYFDGATTQTITSIGTATSSTHYITGSKPSLTVNSVQQTGLVLGAENKIGEVTVSADAAGQIKVATTTFVLSTSGITSPVFSGVRVADGNTTIAGTSCTIAGACTMGGYTIAAGTSKTFSLFGTISGTPIASTVVSVSSAVSASGFTWDDTLGGGTGITGANIYNFPTASYSVRQ